MSSFPILLRVISAGAVESVVPSVANMFRYEVGGHPVTVSLTFGTAGQTLKRLATEPVVDVVISPDWATQKSVREGTVVADTCLKVAGTDMAVFMRSGALTPDISSVNKLRQALLVARSFVYTNPNSGGTGGAYVRELLEHLGIAGVMDEKTVLRPNGKTTSKAVADGEADMCITMRSEGMSVEGLALVGPLPIEVQKLTTYWAGLATKAMSVEAGRAFIAFLTREEFRTKFVAAGLAYK